MQCGIVAFSVRPDNVSLELYFTLTFFGVLNEEFVPVLNNEHLGFAWIDSGHIPKPLHPGLWSTINIDEIQVKIKQIEKSI